MTLETFNSETVEVTPEVKVEKPKTCVTCTHLLGKRERIDSWKETWKCYHPNNIKDKTIHKVTGEDIVYLRVDSIQALQGYYDRDCAKPEITCNGDWWEEYVYTPYVAPTIGGKTANEIVFDEDQLAANRAAAAEKIAKAKLRKLKPNDLDNL